MSILAILATTFGIITSISYYPQLYKIIKRKSSEDISLMFFGIITLSVFFWLLYGIEIKNYPIIIPNVLSLMGSFSVLGFSIYYKRTTLN